MLTIFEKMFRLSSVAKVALVLVFVMSSFVMATDKLVVAVSFAPYAYLIETIGGKDVEVVTLLPPGTDPYNYKPNPAELLEFSRADVYFTDGSGVDRAWLPRFKELKKNMDVVDISEGFSWVAGEKQEPDPFVWTSPKSFSRFASNVRLALSKYRPEKTESFTFNLTKLLNRLNRLNDELIRAVVRLPKEYRTIVVTRPQYRYFSRDYSVTQEPVNVAGNEPTPDELKNIIETGRKTNVSMLIVPPDFSQKAKDAISKELGVKVLALDILEYNFINNLMAIVAVYSDIAAERLKKAQADPTKKHIYKK